MAKKQKSENNLEEALQEIEKKFGADAIFKLDGKCLPVEVISTGSNFLNKALGVGGYPKGRIVEIFGPESSGKTTLALHAIAEAQKLGGVCAFIDAEHALDLKYAQNIGVDINSLIVSQPDSGEEALEICDTLVRSNAFFVIVIDSVAALTPRAEIEGDMGQPHMGLQARLMSQGLRKLTSIVSKTNCIVIFTNQIRMKIGIMFGNPETTTGGNALKFYASVRLDIRVIEKIKKDQEVIGNMVRIKIAKNKVGPPFKVIETFIMYGIGIDLAGELLKENIDCGIIEKAGSWYKYNEEKFQGEDNILNYIRNNLDKFQSKE